MKTKGFIAIMLAALMLLCGCGVTQTPEQADAGADKATEAPEAPAVTDEPNADPPVTTDEPDDGTPAGDPAQFALALPEEGAFPVYEAGSNEWQAALAASREAAAAVPDMRGFAKELFNALSEGREGENIVCSPLNIYMAFAMLAECAEGDTRAQILSALGVDDITALREGAAAILEAESRSDGVTTSLLADSIWLNNMFGFNTDALETLAKLYRAGSFWGDPKDPAFSKALGRWIDENTGGLLHESAQKEKLSSDTILALASTIYFKAAWDEEYYEENTERGVFRGLGGDIECSMMKKSVSARWYRGDGFTALGVRLAQEGGWIWYILPDEGRTAEDIMMGAGLDFLLFDKNEAEPRTAHLTAPKLDVSADFDLIEAMEKLGMTDCFDPFVSDFSAIAADPEGLVVSEAKHTARLKTDEKGLEAAAYTEITLTFGGYPADPVDFTLDRPFGFVITGQSNAPLFIGVVNEPMN